WCFTARGAPRVRLIIGARLTAMEGVKSGFCPRLPAWQMNSLGPQWYDVAFSVGPAMTFNELTKLLEVEGFEETAAELHGIICGRLVGGERLHGDKLRHALLASLHSEEELIDNALPSLSRLYQQSLAGLTDPGFAFKPLLPGEETSLAERVEA